MINCDGRTHNVCVGDVILLLDDRQYRILKTTPPPGPVILKTTNHSTYRSFLRAPSHIFISTPCMVNQWIQADSQLTDTENPLTRDILQRCGLAPVEAYHRN